MTSCMHKKDQISKKDQEYLKLAFSVAERSREKGSHPFGAVLVCEGKFFLSGENHMEQKKNPMKHAEIVLLDRYLEYKKFDPQKRLAMSPGFYGELPDIKDCQMFTSTQPCTMCEGAIYTMKVGINLKDKNQVVFGLDKDNLSLLVRGYSAHDRKVKIAGPYLLNEAKLPHIGFWR